jgi:hypothetical protein
MLWLYWQQRKADGAESKSIRRYLARRAAQRTLCETIVEAQRLADAYYRLDVALQGRPPQGIAVASLPRS